MAAIVEGLYCVSSKEGTSTQLSLSFLTFYVRSLIFFHHSKDVLLYQQH